MVDTLHRRGIKVVLDMVYNHTVECLGKYVYSFEGLVPGYYYRRKRDGHYWNGSGVGNEFRSEAPMARRFIIDSVKYWVTEYKIDGFRFDLMGLIDLVTLIELTKELQAINPDIFIYGEPWTGGDSPIQGVSKGQQRGLGMAVFNDHLRDALKGSVFQARTQGFVQSGDDIVRVKQGIRGAINDFADAPTESINYVECHDNHTLWDRLLISTLDDGRINEAKRRSMNRLAAALLFTAQGIPFIQSGQELLRSKNGHDNTYNQPDAVNMIRWGQKAQNYEIFCYYKGLIALRRAHPLFRLRTALEITNALKFLDSSLGFNLPAQTIGVLITDPTGYDGWQRALLLFNAQTQPVTMTIPVGRWQIFVDHLQASAQPLTNSSLHLEPTSMRVPAHSAVILGEGT